MAWARIVANKFNIDCMLASLKSWTPWILPSMWLSIWTCPDKFVSRISLSVRFLKMSMPPALSVVSRWWGNLTVKSPGMSKFYRDKCSSGVCMRLPLETSCAKLAWHRQVADFWMKSISRVRFLFALAYSPLVVQNCKFAFPEGQMTFVGELIWFALAFLAGCNDFAICFTIGGPYRTMTKIVGYEKMLDTIWCEFALFLSWE